MDFSCLLVSKDQNTIQSIDSISKRRNFRLTLQPVIDNVILSTLEKPPDLFFFDMMNDTKSHMDTLNIIKSLNPRLPIIVLTEDNSIDTLKNLAQLNIYYCALKPIQTNEIECLIDAIKAIA